MHSRICDFSIGGMFMWRSYYHMDYAVENGIFFPALSEIVGDVYYNLPLGGNLREGLLLLEEHLRAEGKPLRFCGVPECYLSEVLELFPNSEVIEQEIYADYLYRALDLANLSGKKYSPQRNLISQFKRACESWSFEDLTSENLPLVEEFFLNEYISQADNGVTEREENTRVLEVLRNNDIYCMSGGVLFADGRVAGFTLGEKINDTVFVHIEKANRTIKGAYQMLTNQFAIRMYSNGAEYLNREEDMGDLGLRRAKQAYHPCELLKKYIVNII